MKKLITLFLILTLILPAATYAEMNELTLPNWPDLSGFTDDQLIILSHQIQLLLFDKKLVDGIEIPQGTYIVGEDIPEGKYRIIIDQKTYIASIEVTKKGDQHATEIIAVGENYNTYEIGKIVLEEGSTVVISYGNMVFYPYTGLFY